MTSSLCFGAGILFDDADRAQNPYKRTLQEQVDIDKYLSKFIGQWFFIHSVIELGDLNEKIADLRVAAKSISTAARSTLQKVRPDPVYLAPICASDVMRSGLNHASRCCSIFVEEKGDENGEDFEFSWGSEIDTLSTWASAVDEVPRMKLKTKRKKKKKGGNSSNSGHQPPDNRAYYGVARGWDVDVFTDLDKVKKATDGFPGKRYKRNEFERIYYEGKTGV